MAQIYCDQWYRNMHPVLYRGILYAHCRLAHEQLVEARRCRPGIELGATSLGDKVSYRGPYVGLYSTTRCRAMP